MRSKYFTARQFHSEGSRAISHLPQVNISLRSQAHDNRNDKHRDSRTEHGENGVRRPAAAVSARSAVYHQAVGLYIISRKAAYHHGEAVYKKYTAKHGYYKITAKHTITATTNTETAARNTRETECGGGRTRGRSSEPARSEPKPPRKSLPQSRRRRNFAVCGRASPSGARASGEIRRKTASGASRTIQNSQFSILNYKLHIAN